MTIINDSLVQIWSCMDCGWQGDDDQLRKVHNDKFAQSEWVCPECDCSPYPHTEYAKMMREKGEW